MRKPTLSYLLVWGCAAEAMLFNLQLKKLDSKTMSCHIIRYPTNSKGYRFYCPDCHTKFVETRQDVFQEDTEISGSLQRHVVSLEEMRAELHVSMTQENTPLIHDFVPEVSVPPPHATSNEIPV